MENAVKFVKEQLGSKNRKEKQLKEIVGLVGEPIERY